MKLITFKINNKRLFVLFFSLTVCFLIFLEFLSAQALNGTASVTDNAARVAFIKGLGLTPNEEVQEEKQVIIPEKFNNVYLKYNEIQKAAGYDLTDYYGKTVTVYRYMLPQFRDGTDAYVNLMILDGSVIGGDISSVELNGFMLPLKEIK